MNDGIKIKVEGFVKIHDVDTGEVLLDSQNDVHLENFSEAIALALGDYPNGFIEEMHFGSGASTVSLTGNIIYNDNQANPQTGPPNREADIYGATSSYPTYYKVVNDRSSRFTGNPNNTNIRVQHTAGTQYTDLIVTCTLEYGEPSGQSAFDDSSTLKANYIFDEIGLKTYDANTGTRRLLTHIIFHPVQKAANRAIAVIYKLRITMVA